jgi:hypothetical protein
MRSTTAAVKKNLTKPALHSREKKLSEGLVIAEALPSSAVPESPPNDVTWLQDIIVLRKAAEDKCRRENQNAPPRVGHEKSFREIADLLEDQSPATRKWAVRTLYDLNADLAATLVNDALLDGSAEQRRNIGTALAESGLLFEAIDDLMTQNHERCYGAFSLLLLVAKAGVVQPLMTVIEKHPSIDLRLAVIRLLASSREMQVATALQGFVSRDSLAPELRSETLKAIRRITGNPA